jgi:protein-tyrosine phosphatase
MAEAVFRQMVKERGLEKEIEIDSAGLGGWHAGERPHRGTLEVLTKHGIPHDSIRSRQIQRSDIQNFDYIIAMDEENVEGLRRLGAEPGRVVFRLLELVDEQPNKNVPDPYYTGNFDEVYDLVRVGCERLLEKIIRDYGLQPTRSR